MQYDLAVIGAGWAGFNAAIKARQLGLKVALIEKDKVGGTCLNYGCIPTKTLIQSAKVYSLAQKAKTFGVELGSPRVNFGGIQARKTQIIQQLSEGMRSLLRGVDLISEPAQITAPGAIETSSGKIKPKFILLATGSKPLELKNLKFDGKKIISSNELLDLKEVPSSILVIGGGVIGCEFAGLFCQLGAQVTVAEKMPQLLPGIDQEICRKLEVIFKKKGVKINTGIDATTLDFNAYDIILLCIGRTPNTQGLGLEELSIETENGRIKVDEYLKTSVPNIYAAGDCCSKIMLAHFAAYQGRLAVENMRSDAPPKKFSSQNIPSCIFTDPEIGCVGLSEEEARKQGFDIKINKFDFMGSGMARILEETQGFVKIISEIKTAKILGSSIIGPRSTELIGIMSVAIQSGLDMAQLKNIILAHPTLSETISEAAHGI